MTPEEAAAAENYEAERHRKLEAPVAADRSAPPVGGDRMTPKTYQEFLEPAGGGKTGGYNNFWLSEGTKFITVDGQKRSSLIVDPAGRTGAADETRGAEAERRFCTTRVAPDAAEGGAAGPAGAFDGPEVRPLAERCLLGFLLDVRAADAAELFLQQPQADRADADTRHRSSTRWCTMCASSG